MTTIWYHGDSSNRVDFSTQQWDRARFTSSLNEAGPGIYFTSSCEEAETYGRYIYAAKTMRGFRFCPTVKAPTSTLLLSFAMQTTVANREIFIDTWGEEYSQAGLKRSLSSYLDQSTFTALQSLYGDLFRFDAQSWVLATRKIGFDGVVVDRANGVQHLVVWDPTKLKISDATCPK
jgi:hypothetical protein